MTKKLTILLSALLMSVSGYADVTYHILTLPISTTPSSGKLHDWNFDAGTYSAGNYRYEALVCTSTSTTVELPDEFKSPLLKDAAYKYYSASKITKTSQATVYANNSTKLDLYQINQTGSPAADETPDLTAGSSSGVSDGDHIYVVYTYDPSSGTYCTAKGQSLKLDGSEKYNIQISKDRFMAYNRTRNNRLGAPRDNTMSSDDTYFDRAAFFTRTKEVIFKDEIVKLTDKQVTDASNNHEFYFHFFLQGGDPYHIIIQTAYSTATDEWTYTQNNLKKKPDGAILYGKLNGEWWMQNEDSVKYTSSSVISTTSTPGRFKENGENSKVTPVVSAFVLLNHPGFNRPSNWQSFDNDGGEYVFVASKMNYNGQSVQPTTAGQYYYLQPNGGNSPHIKLPNTDTKQTYNNMLIKIGTTVHYLYKVKTPFGNYVSATLDMSTIFSDDDPMTCIPDGLMRKYVTFTGAYRDDAMTSPVSTFAAAATCTTETVDGVTRKVIYLSYETDMPFETCLESSPAYGDLTWYNFYTNKEPQYIAWAEKKNDNNADITNYNFHTAKNHSRYGRDSHFAFVGDPFEMKIVSRKASDDAGSLKYITINSEAPAGNYIEGDGTSWEIIYDDNTGNYSDCFRLKKFNETSTVFGWHYGTGKYALFGGATQASRLTVIDVPTKSYVYHIMRNNEGDIAAKATVTQEVSTKLDYAHIPEIIRSPFVDPALDVTLSFYASSSDASSGSSPITYAPDDGSSTQQDIWVRYDLTSMNNTYKAYIDGSTAFNVRLNGEYIYYDSSSGTIKSSANIVDSDSDGSTDDETIYQWKLGGSDPYAMTVQSAGNSDKYVEVADWSAGTITWSESAPASKFIIKSGTAAHVYEVMAATGDTVDADTAYYNIGRPDANTVQVYGNATYQHGYSQLRFQLTPLAAHDVTYHLIDKAGVDLIHVVARHADTDVPHFPDDYWSPLVAQYHYWLSGNFDDAGGKYTLKASQSELDTVRTNTDIYVTYDVSDAYDLQNKRIMYLLKYEMGTPFRAEDGSDGLEESPVTPVYPYCNGDCNFFVYGQTQYDLQQQSAATTRTRWAWFLESANNDPYHVKICSRQTETYNGDQARAYFHTYKPSDYEEVVTTLAWPGISSIPGTEYMILGSIGQFRLVTTYGIDLNNDGDLDDSGENVRHTVNSFEQYWKTWDTIRKKVLGDSGAKESQTDPNTVPATPATAVATAAGKNNRTYLTETMGWHSYEQWAYAKRWNGYNISGAKSKGWESIEHWYQTVQMGEGYFDLIPAIIDPALILLDQHGWEIMRKPLPSSEEDPQREAKHAAIRVYDSPMVEEYHFWTGASKRTGFHQYYNLTRRISVDGEDYSTTSLGDLPPIDATNVKDAKGNIYDQYVTYVAKDEYAQSYDPVNKTGKPFLIRQGNKYASYNGTTLTKTAVPTGGMLQYIIDNSSDLTAAGTRNVDLWYLKPNADIDTEMGYNDAAHDNFDAAYKDATGIAGFNTNGFDPYNIQISSVHADTKYFLSNATSGEISEGAWEGNGASISLGEISTQFTATGHDGRRMPITDATFMAVQDESGNMMLMPRFDHEKRVMDFDTLVEPNDPNIANAYTILYRPLVYTYKIIDNSGSESLRYQSGGDLVPQTPDWFKSQLAKDFRYYKTLTSTGTNTYNLTTLADEITESLEGASLTDNTVYVRYSYDADADYNHVLQGKWLTMTLNNKDTKYDSGIKEGSSKPSPVDGDDKEWQWKFLATPQSDPDPYAVSLYNRSQSGTATVNDKTKFALLNWYDNNGIDPDAYTLAVAGTGETTSYTFVNGASMDASTAATTATETNVKSTSCSYTAGAKIVLNDDVQHTYSYRIYTNDSKFAVSATQTQGEAEENLFMPVLPAAIQSPLLHLDQYRYYNRDNLTLSSGEASITEADTTGKSLHNLYGLYHDSVYVRYTAYDLLTTEYKVPNVKTTVDSKVARDAGSNDAALDINGELIYNIIWYNDNMMQSSDNTSISDGGAHALDGADAYVWQFEGNDPYAIKIKHKKAGKYAVGTSSLAESATSTFMLLPAEDGWQYGMLQVTGGTNKLSGYGEQTVASDPTKFIIFGLSTNKVIYHLVIENIGSTVNIPYSKKDEDGVWVSGYSPSDNNTKTINGTSKRDLTSTTTVTGDTYQLGSTKSINSNSVNYCVDQGHITLGDPLKVPSAFKRPNCKYFFYVDGIYDEEACTTPNTSLNNTYKGLQITRMGTETDLLGKTVVINIVYEFDDGLPTNTGSQFVTNANGTEWYTFETNDAAPWLAHFPYDGGLDVNAMAGRDPHYTNDFLWSPVGDPYGFWMYNRYVYKNGGQTSNVMTTKSEKVDDVLTPTAPANDVVISLESPSVSHPEYAIFELLPGTSDGCFKVQTLTSQGGMPYYINNNSGTVTLQSTSATEWTFGLSEAQLKPYYDRAGYVGGLTPDGVTAYEAADGDLQTLQSIVYDDDSIVSYAQGYYRLHSLPNADGITTPRYMSGYLHETEKTAVSGGIPMHFYSRMGVNTTFEALESGFTSTAATRGLIPIPATEYDPSTIFYFAGTGSTSTMQTQGLYVKGNTMTATEGDATSFIIEDIGGGAVVINGGAGTPSNKQYLCYNVPDSIYDIRYNSKNSANGRYSIVDKSKWCMEPANKTGLYVETHSGGEEETLTDLWYYASLCVPFDLLVSNKNDDPDHSSNAYTCVESESAWDGEMLHPKSIGKYVKDSTTYPATLRYANGVDGAGNDYFVPAGTPVLFSTKRATSYIKATIPTTSPSTPVSTIFSYEYLEQLLTPYVDSRRVYVFGPKMEGTISLNTSTGAITAELPSLGNTNVGFHINANPNKELGMTRASWIRNNYYVLHNKIYYRAPAGGGLPPAIQFMPVLFDDEDEEQEKPQPDDNQQPLPADGVYDLLGRKVASEAELKAGTWRLRLTPGIYITEGKKIFVQ